MKGSHGAGDGARWCGGWVAGLAFIGPTARRAFPTCRRVDRHFDNLGRRCVQKLACRDHTAFEAACGGGLPAPHGAGGCQKPNESLLSVPTARGFEEPTYTMRGMKCSARGTGSVINGDVQCRSRSSRTPLPGTGNSLVLSVLNQRLCPRSRRLAFGTLQHLHTI